MKHVPNRLSLRYASPKMLNIMSHLRRKGTGGQLKVTEHSEANLVGKNASGNVQFVS